MYSNKKTNRPEISKIRRFKAHFLSTELIFFLYFKKCTPIKTTKIEEAVAKIDKQPLSNLLYDENRPTITLSNQILQNLDYVYNSTLYPPPSTFLVFSP